VAWTGTVDPLPVSTDLTGHRLDHYILRERLGGNMGDVYRAWDTSLEREVALKVLAADRLTSESDRVRFRREAQRAGQVGAHPNVVTVYGAGEENGWPYIAMQILRGEDLAQSIQREGAMAPERAVRLLEQAAAALDHLHSQDPPIVHRDVKPANFMLLTGDRLILTDFGLARRTDDTRLTQTGAIIGSPSYMAPEQVMGAGGGKPIGKAADIYSLAAMAYEMLSGRPPFSSEHFHAVLHAHVALAPPSIRTIRPELPAGLDVVLARGLAKSAEQRHPSASALITDLSAALGHLRGVATADSRTHGQASPATRTLAPPGCRFRGARIIFALVIIGACGFSLLLLMLIGSADWTFNPSTETYSNELATAEGAVATAIAVADSAQERLDGALAARNPGNVAVAQSTRAAALASLAQARVTRAAARATATAIGPGWDISFSFGSGPTPSPTPR